MRITRMLRCQRNVKEVIQQVYEQGPAFGYLQSAQKSSDKPKTVVVEYSSPNIAKPFHTGHLRSTLIGHFVANLYERLGWNVIRLNYLGDWGTQFGLLVVGFEKYGCETALAADPLQHLFEVYVKVNADVEEETSKDENTTMQAGLAAFQKMEEGDTQYLELWKRFREISMKEYNKMYKRLGVHFTETHYESTYAKPSLDLVDRLRKEGLLKIDKLDRQVFQARVPELGAGGIKTEVLQKSDGTTLYLTRDITALLDRYEKFKFDKIHYVVEDGQRRHFIFLQKIMELLPGWENRLNEDMHIKFGRINGMSTRKGNVVFLSDVLDRARENCKTTLQSKETTKVSEDEVDEISEELARSSIVVGDLNKQRLKSYSFSWDRMMYFKTDSGLFLQYCHSRLCNLEARSAIDFENDLDFDESILSDNKEAAHLIQVLQEYPKRVENAVLTLEPYYIARCIIKICHAANRAYKTCNVIHAEPEVAKARLHMFRATRLVIADGMRLLGLNPLENM